MRLTQHEVISSSGGVPFCDCVLLCCVEWVGTAVSGEKVWDGDKVANQSQLTLGKRALILTSADSPSASVSQFSSQVFLSPPKSLQFGRLAVLTLRIIRKPSS